MYQHESAWPTSFFKITFWGHSHPPPILWHPNPKKSWCRWKVKDSNCWPRVNRTAEVCDFCSQKTGQLPLTWSDLGLWWSSDRLVGCFFRTWDMFIPICLYAWTVACDFSRFLAEAMMFAAFETHHGSKPQAKLQPGPMRATDPPGTSPTSQTRPSWLPENRPHWRFRTAILLL